MFCVIPFFVDVPMRCRPWMNWVIIAVTIFCFPFMLEDGDLSELGEKFLLDGENTFGWIGHIFVHADLIHLLGNMLFLWVFGNAVCAKVGNITYLFVYLFLGLISAIISWQIDPRPSIGASGAINGIVGIFLIWYLLNDIACWYFYWLFTAFGTGTFAMSSFWMILMWFGFDLFGAFADGDGNTDYWAHIAGFGTGASLAFILTATRIISMDPGERSLVQMMFGDATDAAPQKRSSKKTKVTRFEPDSLPVVKPKSKRIDPIASLVLFCKRTPDLDLELWRTVLSDTFELELELQSEVNQPNSVSQDRHGRLKACFAGRVFQLEIVPNPYFENPIEETKAIASAMVRDAIIAHESWLQLDLLSQDETANRREPEWYLGRILNAVATNQTIAIYNPKWNRTQAWSGEVPALVAKGQIEAAFDATVRPITGIASQDFLNAFQQREPEERFQVKIAHREGATTDSLWIGVTGVDQEVIQGKIEDVPDTFQKVPLGGRVKFNLKQIQDWRVV
jgi:membrane associated rhomboid family serine protease